MSLETNHHKSHILVSPAKSCPHHVENAILDGCSTVSYKWVDWISEWGTWVVGILTLYMVLTSFRALVLILSLWAGGPASSSSRIVSGHPPCSRRICICNRQILKCP